MSDDYTTTPNYGLYKPTPNADYDLWGDHLNANADRLDTVLSTISDAVGLAPVGVANVVAFGADPTAVADSTDAFNAACSQHSPDGIRYRAVYVPTGTYRLNSTVTLRGIMFGDGRATSILLVDDNFSSDAVASPCVIMLYSHAVPGAVPTDTDTGVNMDTGAEISDLAIRFMQPTTGCARANFKTLAAGGTVATGVMYPPAICVGNTARHKIVDVRISCAWDGITTNGMNAVLYLDNVEMSALNVGLKMGVGTAPGVGRGLKDTCHIKSYHFWSFDIPSAHLTDDLYNGVYSDGNTIAAQFGEVDGLEVDGFMSFRGRVQFLQDATWGAEKGSYHFANMILDYDATLEINAAAQLDITNFTANSEFKCLRSLVKINPPSGIRARVNISNFHLTSAALHSVLNVSGAATQLNMTNGRIFASDPSTNAIAVFGGVLRMTNVKCRPAGPGIWSSASSSGALSGTTPIAAGGTGATVNDTFTDPYGGRYTATTVSGGAVTVLRMDKVPAIFGATPANPIPLTAINSNTPTLLSTTPVAGGVGYLVGDVLRDSYGSNYTVTGVGGTSGTAITTVSLTTARVFLGTAPSNPVPLIDTAGGGIGTGATVNLSWVTHVSTAVGVTANLVWTARVSNTSSLASTTPAAGGGGFLVGDQLTDIYGNRYTAQAIDGFGGITTISIETARVFVGATPSNPVALTAVLPSVGISASVNLTWTTSPAGAAFLAQSQTGIVQLDNIDIGGLSDGDAADTSSGIALAINTDMPGTSLGNITLGDNWIWTSVAHSAQPGSLINWLPTNASYVDDAAASAAGIGIGQFYRNGNALMVRTGSAAGSPIALPATTAPLMDGVANAGTQSAYARADHVHPTDTSRAPLANPVFTGDPQAPTPAATDNDTSVATTAFVKSLASTTSPLMDAAALIGGSLNYARADHSHPSDTSRLPLTGGTISGPLAVNGLFSQLVNLSGALPTVSGTGGVNLGWNSTSGQAEVDFFNTFLNATTGFNFYQYNTTTSATLILSVSGAGVLTVPGLAKAATPSANDNSTNLATTAFVQGNAPTTMGRNLAHNPLFTVQQRGQGPWTTNAVYLADRYVLVLNAPDTDSVTITTLADADRAAIGDEAAAFALTNVFVGSATGGASSMINQKVEGVRRLAGKSVTVSCWAMAASGTPKLALGYSQNFGTGGSPSTAVFGIGQLFTLSTTWTRYSATFTIPSIAGKTLGNNNNDNTQIEFWYSAGTLSSRNGNIGAQSGTISLWGVQIEIGPVRTPFERPSLTVDLEHCQRFYQTFSAYVPVTTAPLTLMLPTSMRAAPTVAGGGAGFVTTGATASAGAVTVGQTTGAAQTLTLTADL